MKLYVMRHGEAVTFVGSDRERPLTDHGRQQVEKVASQLLGTPLTGILVSPYLRTRETAELMRKGMNLEVPLSVCDQLTPDSTVQQVLSIVPDDGQWLLVSHMPLVSRLVGLLTEDAPERGMAFSTAMVVELELTVPASGLATAIERFTP